MQTIDPDELIDYFEEALDVLKKDSNTLHIISKKMNEENEPLIQIIFDNTYWAINFNINKKQSLDIFYDRVLGALYQNSQLLTEEHKNVFYNKILPTAYDTINTKEYTLRHVKENMDKFIKPQINHL